MPDRHDSSERAVGARQWLVVWQLVLAVGAVGTLAHAASGQQTSDPAIAQVLRELHAQEDEPLTVASAQAQTSDQPFQSKLALERRLTVARAQALIGDPAAARATLQRAIVRTRDTRGLLAIEKVQAEMGDRDAALKTLLLARNSEPAGSQPQKNQRPSVNGRVELVDVEFDALVQKRLFQQALCEIAVEQSRLGDRAAAIVTFEHALQFAMTLLPRDRRGAIVGVIIARAEAGEFDAALNQVASLGNRAERFEALTQINLRDRIVDTRVLERILQMFDTDGNPPELPKDTFLGEAWLTAPKLDALIAMALAQHAKKDRAAARRTLAIARRIAEAEKKEDSRYGKLIRIARAMVKIGDAAEATQMAVVIGKSDPYWKWRIPTVIAEAHAEIGDPTNKKAWENALQAAGTAIPKLRLLFQIAAAQTEAGEREAALGTLDQALAVARSTSADDLLNSGFAYCELVEAQIASDRAEAGDITGAIKLANTIENVQFQGHALAGIAAAQAASGDIRGALESAGRIQPPDPKGLRMTHLQDEWYAFPKIITAQARAGDVAGALAAAQRMGLSRTGRLWALSSIAEGLHQRNAQQKGAQAVLGTLQGQERPLSPAKESTP